MLPRPGCRLNHRAIGKALSIPPAPTFRAAAPRCPNTAALLSPNDGSLILRFDRYDLDESTRELRRDDGARVSLTTAEFELLRVFVSHPQRSLSRAEVIELLAAGAVRESGRSVDVTISRLRRKIEQDPHKPNLIKTVRDKGYFFAPAVHHEVAPTSRNPFG